MNTTDKLALAAAGVIDGTAYEQNMFAGFGLSCRSYK